MIVMAETFQDTALLLDDSGRVWEVKIDYDNQPVIRMLERVERETIKRLMGPQLARYVPHP